MQLLLLKALPIPLNRVLLLSSLDNVSIRNFMKLIWWGYELLDRLQSSSQVVYLTAVG